MNSTVITYNDVIENYDVNIVVGKIVELVKVII